MEKLTEAMVKAIDRSNPFMQNLQLGKRFNKLVEEGGDVSLEDNHETTINVAEYTDSVEITPTEGKDGMKKATITLSNIPQAGATLYAWKNTTNILYTKVETPTTSDKALIGASTGISEEIISAVGEGTITVDNVVYARDTDSDLGL